MTERDIYAPIKIAGAGADAAIAGGRAASANAAAANAEAHAANAIASMEMATVHDATVFAESIVREEAESQFIAAQQKHKLAAADIDKNQNRVDANGDPAHLTLNDYAEQQTKATQLVLDDFSNPLAYEQYQKWSSQMNAQSYGSHVKRADGWRREDNVATITQSVGTMIKAENWAGAQAALNNSKEVLSPGQTFKLQGVLDTESTKAVITEQASLGIKTGNQLLVQDAYDETYGNPKLTRGQGKIARTNILNDITDATETSFGNKMDGNVITMGVDGAIAEGTEALSDILATSPDNFVGGEEGKLKIYTAAKKRLGFYKSADEDGLKAQRKLKNIVDILSGESVSAPGSLNDKNYTIGVNAIFRNEVQDGKGNFIATEDSLTDKQILEKPIASGEQYAGMVPVQKQHYIDARTVDMVQASLATNRPKNDQQGALDFIMTIAQSDPSLLYQSKFNTDTLKVISAARSSLGVDGALDLNRRIKENQQVQLPQNFKSEASEILNSETYSSIPGWLDDDIKLNIQDRTAALSLAEYYGKLGYSVDESVSFAANHVASGKTASNAAPTPQNIPSHLAVEGGASVNEIAKLTGTPATTIAREVGKDIGVQLEGAGIDLNESYQIIQDINIPENEGVVVYKVVGMLAGTGVPTTMAIEVDVANLSSGKEAVSIQSDNKQEAKEANSRNIEMQKVEAFEATSGIDLNQRMINTRAYDKALQAAGITIEQVQRYLQRKAATNVRGGIGVVTDILNYEIPVPLPTIDYPDLPARYR